MSGKKVRKSEDGVEDDSKKVKFSADTKASF
jgi:hypothetical protein